MNASMCMESGPKPKLIKKVDGQHNGTNNDTAAMAVFASIVTVARTQIWDFC